MVVVRASSKMFFAVGMSSKRRPLAFTAARQLLATLCKAAMSGATFCAANNHTQIEIVYVTSLFFLVENDVTDLISLHHIKWHAIIELHALEYDIGMVDQIRLSRRKFQQIER